MEGIIEQDKFYALILHKLDADMNNEGISAKDLPKKDVKYIISQRQYYNIKRIAEAKEAPLLSNSRLEKVCKHLGITYKPLYQVLKNGVNILQ